MAVTYMDRFTEALRVGIVVFLSVLFILSIIAFIWTRMAVWHAKREARNEPQPYDWAERHPEMRIPKEGHVEILDTVPREWF